ncbi:phospholipid-transporting ATPase ABCA3-like [Porites lutea]|uniref:phospholipid-transporting ATPase ABCA3-like n=1 Tax=Porites lutea TaxID=51062 RepID=UPI003CC552D4
MANRFRQFRLLLWKNFILQIRRPIGTVFELLLPVLLVAVLILPKQFIDTEDFCFSTFEPMESRDLKEGLFKSLLDEAKKDISEQPGFDVRTNITKLNADAMKSIQNKTYLAYYPTSPLVTKLMTTVVGLTGLKLAPRSLSSNKSWASGDEMAKEASESDDYFGAFDFAISADATELPKQVKYSLRLPHEQGGSQSRWRTENTYPNFQAVGPRKDDEGFCCKGYRERFVPLQYAIDMAIIQEQSNSTKPILLKLQQFPYPKYTQNFFIQTVQGLLPLLMTLAFMYSAVMVIKELVHEKQNRLKESMKMMGLANWIHWTAWFTKNLLFLLISIIIVTALLKGAKIFQFSDGGLLFVFLLLYIIASIMFCFAISVFFSRPVVGMLFGAVLWYCSLVPFQTFSQQEAYEALSRAEKAASCLLPNTCLGIATYIIARFESNEVGLTWDKVSASPTPEDDFSFSMVLGMLIIQSIIYGIIAWYVEAVFPGSYGIPRPFYFPFTKSYWCGTSSDDVIDVRAEQEMNPVERSDNPDIEDETHDLPVGVGIKDLRKVFKGSAGSKVAVDGLSLQMYKGQITALLGHNGAGKTTTMSILTGLFPPTSGSAHINGKSILTDMDAIRESLGLCPQHNVLFDRLTVKEHLEFFINLKGTFGEQAQMEVLQMINDVQLTDKMNWSSSKLSGGMKRKLSCAIALIGGSQTVFLDEPTSGMDPYARRGTWDLLLKHKAGKTIILTTHFMDEADFLGDRIAIMADGQLRCCGSSLFLKSRYGVGYHLTLVKKEECNQNSVTSLIVNHVPDAQLLSSVGAEMEFVLSSEHSNGFETLFQEIENKMEEYGIASFGVSVTTLEEVFMKVGEGAEKTVDDLAHDHNIAGQEAQQIVNIAEVEDPQGGGLQTGLSLKWQQYKAMFLKRFLNSKRDKKAIITQLVLPLLMVLFGLLLITSIPTRTNDPPRVLKLSNLSVDDVFTKAFFADYRNVSSDVKQGTLKNASNYLKSVKVDVLDITSKVYNIRDGNQGNNITVRNTFTQYDNESKACCNYEFYVLNSKCKSLFISQDLKPDQCSDSNFGYKDCPKCILANVSGYEIDKDKTCSAVGCPGTNLKNLNTYFSEYVLEQSNASNYFNVYVAGFSLAPQIPPMSTNMSNMTNNKGMIPAEKRPDTETTLWYSNEGYHTIAEALSAMSNILLTDAMGDDSYSIEATNYPLPNTIKNKADNVTSDFSALLLAIFLALGMAFMSASFVTFIVQERVSKAKHLQFVSGVDVVSYWFATYTWDFINYLVPALGILILFAAFQVESYEDELGIVFLMLILFGLCVLPFVYCLSFIFKSPLVGYVLIVFVLSILSLAMLITVFVLQVPTIDLKDEADVLHYIFMLVPTYTLAYAFVDLNANYGFRKVCNESPVASLRCEVSNVKYTDHGLDWERPGIGQMALYLFIESVVLFILVLLIEVKFFLGGRLKTPSGEFQSNQQRNEDGDVSSERTRINNMTPEGCQKEAVVLRDLTKVYGGTRVTAVDHLCLGIPRGECFGLLGINGAGKTTTFSMLTGDLSITEGTALLDGYDIRTNLREVQQRIGYCPQFDALIERLTGREMLTMYANLRGVQPAKINDLVSSTIKHLNLTKWADKLCGDYSGGNKRKLSTAIALVGNPPIVFLDEPTTGMDPVARRFLWDSLMTVMKGGRSIVLTSHSMEECEALCTRLAIMVNGKFKCLGSTQHLKSRFGTGYTLMIKVTSSMPANAQPIANGFHPEGVPIGQPPISMVYSNPVATSELPEVNEPDKSRQEVATNGTPSGISSHDIQPSVPVPTYQPPAQTFSGIIYDRGLMEAVTNAQNFVAQTFPGARLLESHNGVLHFQVETEGLSWSYIFGQLERNRAALNIIDYSVSQTTLEQVFINFAKEQHSEERTSVKKTCGCLP